MREHAHGLPHAEDVLVALHPPLRVDLPRLPEQRDGHDAHRPEADEAVGPPAHPPCLALVPGLLHRSEDLDKDTNE